MCKIITDNKINTYIQSEIFKLHEKEQECRKVLKKRT